MIPLGPVVARSRMNAARATVWAHLTDPDLRSQWWESFDLEQGLGGGVRSTGEAGELTGVVDVWVAGHALGFTWNAAGAERGTAVLLTLRSQGFQTGITVTETGFDSLTDGAARAEMAGREWARFVEALSSANLVEVETAGAGAGADVGVGAGAAGVAVGAGAVVGTNVVGANTAAAGIDTAVASEASAAEGGPDGEMSSEPTELEVAPLEVEGELTADGEVDPIEVDAEPGLGDHLELVTGPIELPDENELPSDSGLADDDERSDSEGYSEELVPLVLPEPPEVPLVLPEPSATADAGDEDDDEEDDEPDFDSLLRGLL